MLFSDGELSVFVTEPISAFLLAIAAIFLVVVSLPSIVKATPRSICRRGLSGDAPADPMGICALR
jgi:TctA family transporter